MKQRFLAARAGCAALLFLLVGSTSLLAQAPELRGRVVDADGEPVPAVTVVLHRVTDDGGTEIGRAVSQVDGTFTLDGDGIAPGGLYFAATRHDGSLFMGAVFRDLREVEGDYRITVGVNAVGGARTPGPPPPPGAGKGWIVGLLIGGIGVVAVALPLVPRRRANADRAVLLELAELEERFAAGDPELTAGDGQAYRERRAALRARLREL